jgi:hypothetical protein
MSGPHPLLRVACSVDVRGSLPKADTGEDLCRLCVRLGSPIMSVPTSALDLNEIAARVVSSLASHRSSFLASTGERGIPDAYRLPALLRAAFEACGEKITGRKIGFTNRQMWAALVVDEDTAEPDGNFIHSRHQHQALAIRDITQHPFEAVRSKFFAGRKKRIKFPPGIIECRDKSLDHRQIRGVVWPNLKHVGGLSLSYPVVVRPPS